MARKKAERSRQAYAMPVEWERTAAFEPGATRPDPEALGYEATDWDRRRKWFATHDEAVTWMNGDWRPGFIPAADWDDPELGPLLRATRCEPERDGDPLAFLAYLDRREERGALDVKGRAAALRQAKRSGFVPRTLPRSADAGGVVANNSSRKGTRIRRPIRDRGHRRFR